jgi:hypothetical protein
MAHHQTFGFLQVLPNIPGCLSKPHAKFSPAEDEQLRRLIESSDVLDWHAIADQMCKKNPRQCRERYINYLAPDLNTAPWTPAEDMLLLAKYRELGSRWVQIAWFFPNRTDCMVKNRFNKLRRRERRQIGFIGMQMNLRNRLLMPPEAPRPPAPNRVDRPAPPDRVAHTDDSEGSDTPDFGYDMWCDDGSSEAFDIW